MSKASPTRRWLLWLGCVVAGALSLRLPILFTSQRFLRSDEAVVGMMAKHIITRDERPVYLYGQPYGGGHAVVAYIAAPLFYLFGRSALLLTAITIGFSVANVALAGSLGRRLGGERLGLLSAIFLAVAPPVTYTSFLVNGVTETIFLCLICLHLFLSIHYEGCEGLWRMWTLGVVCGAAFWCMDFAIAYPVLFLLAWLPSRDAPRPSWRAGGAAAVGFLVGCAPVLAHDALNGWPHLRGMFAAGGPGKGGMEEIARAFVRLWARDLPGFFHSMIDDFPKEICWSSWAHYAAFLAAVVHGAWAFVGWALIRLRSRGQKVEDRRLPSIFLPVLYIAVFIGMYSLSGFASSARRTPRYLVPLYPLAAVLIGQMVDRVWRERRWVGVMLSGALVGAGLVNDARLVGPAEHTEHGILTRGASVRAAARRLKARGVRYVVTPYEIQWRLIFESDERVVATCAGVSLFERYPPYAEEVFSVIRRGTETYALVFRRDFAFVKLAARYTLGRPGPEFWMERIRQLGERVEREEVNDELVIYYVRPGKTRAEGR